ncbi:hypothetical protein MSAN_01445700 [Mycena sanguinolenta]|uniref:Actin cytoskeleton-regulatory complex protein SLA1 n=1 Tax=Mycena sanguinolenta TaxID=230812 RepID=A0A8H6Y6R0_9AGAR|nr:hypothetical protein MSAN_01445700 [Mycena sanguinolenta]
MGEHHYLAVLKASYDYEPDAGADEEIAIKENQILFLTERVDSDWWKVKVKGESQEEETPEGLVPAAYVEPADHTSTVKALYDYEANAPGELSITEDQVLRVFDTEEEWLLVQTDEDGGKAGFVPANYVEAMSGEEEEAPAPAIVVPDSPPKPAYVDPATRVASSKITADDIKTWSVSEVDKKGKKKKGTLGVGNGAVFFASESDKTPVQKWQTAHITNITVEKSKHVHIDVGGPNPINLHFSVGSKDNSDAIVAKLESSKQLSAPSPTPGSSASRESSPPKEAKKATVHFAPESPTVIPVPDEEEEEEEEEPAAEDEAGGDDGMATVLYDFTADAEDELSVSEGERLVVLEKDGDEWWKCRNAQGREGVVPASYLEGGSGAPAAQEEQEEAEPEPEPEPEEEDDDGAAEAEAEAAREAEERERAERAEAARQAKEKAKEPAEEAAEAERAKRKAQAEAAKARAEKQASPPPATRTPPEPKKKEKSDSARTSLDPAALPPPDRVRVWHDRTGQFRVDAAFLGFNNGKLRLHKTNGVIVEVPAEKMSIEDMKYIEKATSRKSRSGTAPPAAAAAPRRPPDDDDLPLARAKELSLAHPQPKKPTIDWFDFFLSAGCELDDCTRYAQSFERDKIDESILLDITDATMRSLGLREGDIIRVTKAIDKRRPVEKKPIDEGPTKSPPNLFTQPGGVLKAPRRGRPQPTKSLPATVDILAISAGSEEIQRTSSPQVLTPTTVQGPPRSSSAQVPKPSGFDDDAWTNRPSSTQPPATVVSPPPAAAARPPISTSRCSSRASAGSSIRACACCTSTARCTAGPSRQYDCIRRIRSARQAPNDEISESYDAAYPHAPSNIDYTTDQHSTGGLYLRYGHGLIANTYWPTFEQSAHRPPPQPLLRSRSRSPHTMVPVGLSPPVPANQALLAPLIPTQTGFNNFIPTRPGTAPTATTSPFANPFANPPPMQPSFLSSQPTGFPGMQAPLQTQPTGFQPSFISAQPTGAPFGGFNGNTNGFVQSNPTGFAQPPFNNNNAPFNNTNANIFAQMKAGTLGAEDNAPQPGDRYDALRPNPMVVAQPTGWAGGFQGGYGGYH